MSDPAKLRISPGAGGVSIWSEELFGAPDAHRLRDFIARAFSVEDVARLEIRSADAYGRIAYAPTAAPEGVWRKLAQALRRSAHTDDPDQALRNGRASQKTLEAVGAAHLYLGHPARLPIRVSRVGGTLSTWRLRPVGNDAVRLSHPALHRRRDLRHRLEEQIAAIFGVGEVRDRSFSSDVVLRFDPGILTLERLARELERAWPALIEGEDEPPSAKRLFTAGSLLTLAAVAQFAAPALRPVAVGAVVVYAAPNVVAAIRQARHGQVGLPALYSFGLGLMLLSGLPLTGTIMASLMQLWPYLAHRTIVNRQRRLFAAHRKRPTWARVAGRTVEIEVHVDDLKPGDEVVARAGETAPVDGVVIAGAASVADVLGGWASPLRDVAPGDALYAGALVRDGEVTIRVVRAGDATAAAHVGKILPHAAFRNLPSLFDAERVANRNAKPALALATLNLLTVRAPRFSQAVIRPDYITAPRLSAQLSALYDLASGLERGVLFRKLAAVDALADIDVVVFDDSAGLDRRRLAVDQIAAPSGSAEDALAYVATALASDRSERGLAVARLAARRASANVEAYGLRRSAGAIRFRDALDREVIVASPAYVERAGVRLPPKLERLAAFFEDPDGRPVIALRDGAPLGVVTFRRRGEAEAATTIAALKRQNPKLRFVHVSGRRTAAARAAADAAGIEFAFGGLDARGKISVLRGLGRRTIWVGDGAAPEAVEIMAASDVSVSVAGFGKAPTDAADVILLRGELAGLPSLNDLAAARRARIRGDYRTIYAANLLGVAGAFLANFGSLQSGLLSNLGSGLVYARHVRRLNRLIAAIEAQRGRLVG
ncbi:ATPase [Methylopila henanensis]|uniref:ATPase n=1 Tax=Methylopila henanensis TaxID=873516 RepID=A0ABW4K637_9HYPH